jgi:5'/3'-nucleotidase SurE
MMHRSLRPFLLTAVLMISCVIATGASAKPLRILLTNDDGYLAPGIRAMRTTLLDAGHQVFLIAPESNQSGSGTSISPQGIMVQSHGHGVWSVEGRPADAVRYALGHLMKDAPPDLVISGINFGQNVGADVMVSGTVGAAVTAVLQGFPAIAISAEIKLPELESQFPSTVLALPKAAQFLTDQLEKGVLPSAGELINLNFPATQKPKGVRQASLAESSILGSDYAETAEGKWRAGYATGARDAASSDRSLLSNEFITVTPLRASFFQPAPSQATKDAISRMVTE